MHVAAAFSCSFPVAFLGFGVSSFFGFLCNIVVVHRRPANAFKTCLLLIHTYIPTYVQTDRKAGRQAGRQAGGQAGRQAGRQADRQTDRQTDRRTYIQVEMLGASSLTLAC